jgi:hypothetical protein
MPLFVSNCCDISCAGSYHILGEPHILYDSWAWDNRRNHYYTHLPFVATFLLPPYDDGYIYTLSPTASQTPSTSLYQVFPSTTVTSCIFFSRSSCSIIGAFWLFLGSSAHMHTDTTACQKARRSSHGHFYSVLFVVTLDFLFVWCTLLVLLSLFCRCLSHPYPLALTVALPSY